MKYLVCSKSMSWGGIFGDATTTLCLFTTRVGSVAFSSGFSVKLENSQHVKKVHSD